MAKGKVTVVARIKAKPGMEEKVRERLMSLAHVSRSPHPC